MTTELPELPRNRSEMFKVIFTIGARGDAAVMARLVCRLLKSPSEAAPPASGPFWITSLETTVARTIISAVGAWQPPVLLTTQEQAEAGTAGRENAATMQAIRDRIAALNLSRAVFACETAT